MSDTASITKISEIMCGYTATILTFDVDFRGNQMSVEVLFHDAATRLFGLEGSEVAAAKVAAAELVIRQAVESVSPNKVWTGTIPALQLEVDENRIRELGLSKDAG